jgi:alpha-L-fucosidase
MFSRRQFMKIVGAGSLAGPILPSTKAKTPSSFDSSWESLKQYRCPEWYRDAKLMIIACWGPQAQPAQGDWYARNMYIEGSRQYKWHVEHYGHPSKFGYKDIIPLWKAEKWDPDRLMRIYKRAGARCFGCSATHHDNFDLWNSKFQRWNAVNFGPKKDVVGIWQQSAAKHGLRFGVGSGLWASYHWFSVNKGHDQAGPYAGVPYDGNDPKYQDLYHAEPRTPSIGSAWELSTPESWHRAWFQRLIDLVEHYQLDLLSNDGPIPFGETGRAVVASFYNENMKRHGGRLDGVYNAKNDHVHADSGFDEHAVTLNIERGAVDDILPEPWQHETCIADWFYWEGYNYRSVKTIIHVLADVVSKNGNLKLSIPLRGDGTLDDEEENFVAEMGDWMDVNAEAIHGTRPWKIYGEGPTKIKAGPFAEAKETSFTAKDIRFTTKGSTLYAIAMDWPGEQLTIESLASSSKLLDRKIASVQLLGAPNVLKWKQSFDGLSIEMPQVKSSKYAYTFKIALG